MDFRFDLLSEYSSFFIKGTMLTIGLSFAGILLGTIFGLLIGLGKMMQNKLYAQPFNWYISFFMDGGFIVEENVPKELYENPQEERTKSFLSKVL